METVYIAGGALLVPLFVAIAAIGLLGTSATIEIGALATQTVRMRSLPAAWDARRQKRYSVKTAAPGRAKKSSWWRSWLRFLRAPAIAYWTWWLALAGAGLGITVVAIPGLNYLLFEHCLRLALRGVERSHGMVVTYQSADGNLLKGCANLRGARLQRHGDATSSFDVTVDRLDVDCDARKLISGQFAFESVAMNSVRGRFTQNGKRDLSQPQRHYTIARLAIDDANMDFIDRSRPQRNLHMPLQVTTLEVDGYRSRWSLFDLLFRSNSRGTIYGRPFTITSRTTPEAHESVFKATDLPLSLVGQRIHAPLGGRIDGVVDADIRTQWHPHDESTELNMHCRLVAHHFTVRMPNGLVQRAVAPTVASRVPRSMPMEFDLMMDERVFDGQSSLVATGVLDRIGDAASQQRRQVSPRRSTGGNNVFRRFGAGVRSLVSPRGR